MKRLLPALVTLISLTLLGACDNRPEGPLTLSITGNALKTADPNMGPIGPVSRTMLSATAQGLLSFDTQDQIRPALAERWLVTDDGLSTIFRIREAQWSDGRPVTAQDVVNSLKRSIGTGSKNPLNPLFANVRAIIPMTGQVVEIRLAHPDPNLLQLLAQPEMAILRQGGGTGPYVIHSRRDGVLRLRPVPPPAADDEAEEQPVDESKDIRVRAERAALGIVRFEAEGTSSLQGGTFTDLPLARAARIDSARFQLDPAYGLFGLAVSPTSRLLENGQLRVALSLAIDREKLLQRFGVSSWTPSVSILPSRLDSGGAVAVWGSLNNPINERRARARISSSAASGARVRIYLPDGPGSDLLFASLAADWRRVGIESQRVASMQNADLFLIDEVAPVSSALWYMTRLSCGRIKCNPDTATRINLALHATSMEQRGQLIAEADEALTTDNYFIPISRPLRWSLVSPELVGWRPSAFALHPPGDLR